MTVELREVVVLFIIKKICFMVKQATYGTYRRTKKGNSRKEETGVRVGQASTNSRVHAQRLAVPYGSSC